MKSFHLAHANDDHLEQKVLPMLASLICFFKPSNYFFQKFLLNPLILEIIPTKIDLCTKIYAN